MLRYLTNHQIDYSKWDACIEASGQRLVYALSWYLDVVSPGWAGLVEEQHGQYVAVMPLPLSRRFGISYVQQPLFCQQLGFFAVTDAAQPSAFLARLQQQFALISKYSFNTANFLSFELEEIRHLRVYRHQTHHLDLTPDYETIYRQYTRVGKNNLKRSLEAGLQIKESNDINPLIALFKNNAASRIRGGVSDAAYVQLSQLYEILAGKGLATLLYTQTPAGETDAGCLFFIYGQKIIYLFNAASAEGRNRHGRSLMIDYMIQKYAGQSYIFDFESPAAAASVIRFYQGFGATPAPFNTITFNNLPFPVRFLKRARQFIYQKVMATFTSKPDS